MAQTYESKILDHLGLVATMFDELELGTVIDQRIAQDSTQRHVSVGQAVKAMVLNGLGFVNQRLYLVPHFFDTKPTERLVGEGILPQHLNDDTLGRALDALFEAGVTEIFRDLAAHAASRLGLQTRLAHLDATSFHVDGLYNSQDDEPEEGVIHVRQGYSRDHRPELNQVIINLMVENRTGIPLLMQPLSGNTSDAASFPALIKAHLAQLSLAHGIDYVVADAALYSASTIKQLAEGGSRFITRVPKTIKEAQAVLAAAEPEAFVPLTDGYHSDGYHSQTHHSDYGGVRQRWIVIHSEAA
jgi:transposase